jgi:hypothetical protein
MHRIVSINIDHERCRRHFVNPLWMPWLLSIYFIFSFLSTVDRPNTILLTLGHGFMYVGVWIHGDGSERFDPDGLMIQYNVD